MCNCLMTLISRFFRLFESNEFNWVKIQLEMIKCGEGVDDFGETRY